MKVDAVLFNVESGVPLTPSQVGALEQADQINAMISTAVAAERERCAKIAEDGIRNGVWMDLPDLADEVVERIRSGE